MTTGRPVESRAPSLVRWGAVFSGAVIGLALGMTCASLWFALAYSSHVAAFYHHLAWWIAGTAIAATFIAGLLAGTISGTRGIGAGAANGVTTWGLLTLAVVAIATPAVIGGQNVHSLTLAGHTYRIASFRYWTTFWAFLVGLGAGAVGGVMGGLIPRRKYRVAGVVDEVAERRLVADDAGRIDRADRAAERRVAADERTRTDGADRAAEPPVPDQTGTDESEAPVNQR
ncbi:MAG TPA: hypothetical protein VKQ71_17545 [Acidimicrobiales bacterium]|nr:hypothetical protein [Acidimicrobiales bacterium]